MTTGSDEQRPAPRLCPSECAAHGGWCMLDGGHDGLHQNMGCQWSDAAAEPAPESLPDRCEYWSGRNDDANRCSLEAGHTGRHIEKGAIEEPESLPVGTDSARALDEARRQYPFDHGWEIGNRRAFLAGAEWARAEKRKARGE